MKNISSPKSKNFRKKGFFIALYSCLGAVALLALVITFSNREPESLEYLYGDEETVYAGADQVDPFMAQAQEEAWFRPRTPAPPPEQPATPQTPPVPDVDPNDMTPQEPPPPPTPEPPPAPPPAEPRAETFTPFSEEDYLLWPVYGDIAMPFSMTSLVFDPTLDQFRTNDNLRISATEGDPVRAGAEGQVIATGRNIVRGNYVTIDHGDGWIATYGQLMENLLVSEGDIVRSGQVIGGIGQPSAFGSLNGTHLQLRVTRDDQPVNPYELLQARN